LWCPGGATGCISTDVNHSIVGDFNGDGKTEFLAVNASFNTWLSDRGATDALTSINNGLGGTTQISYTPSSSWPNPSLPVGLIWQTEASVVSQDGRGNTATTNYSY